MKETKRLNTTNRQNHPIYVQSSHLSHQQILHVTFHTEKWIIGFVIFNIRTMKMYQLSISQYEIDNSGMTVSEDDVDGLRNFDEHNMIKVQAEIHDDSDSKRKKSGNNNKREKVKIKSKSSNNIKTYKQIRKYFSDIYKLFDYVRKWMKNSSYNNIQIDNNTQAKIQHEQQKKEQKQINIVDNKNSNNVKNYYEGDIYDSEMQSSLIDTNANTNKNTNQQNIHREQMRLRQIYKEKKTDTKIIQFIELQKVLKIKFVRIGKKKGVKKLDKLKLYLQQMERFDDHSRLVRELHLVKESNSRLQSEITFMRIENSTISKSILMLTKMRQQIIKKQQQKHQQQQQQKQKQISCQIQQQHQLQQQQSSSQQQNSNQDEQQQLCRDNDKDSEKQSQFGECKEREYKRMLWTTKEIISQFQYQQQMQVDVGCIDRTRKMKKTQKQQQPAINSEKDTFAVNNQYNSNNSQPQLQFFFTNLQTTLLQAIQQTIQNKLSSLLLNKYHQHQSSSKNDKNNYNKLIKYEDRLSQSHQQRHYHFSIQKQPIISMMNHNNIINDNKFGTKIYLTFDTNSDYFNKQFITNQQQPFTIKKASAVGCYQVLCNELIPLKGRWYFQVYLEKISYGIFSIGVFHPRRRNFQYSHDSKDCVVLFGVGMAIMKNSIVSGKQVTGHGQYARDSYNPVSNNRHLPKLQDDAILKVVVDRDDATIRWYRDQEEIGSTTLPEHLKQQKLLPGFHLNYRDDKVRLNGFYAEE